MKFPEIKIQDVAVSWIEIKLYWELPVFSLQKDNFYVSLRLLEVALIPVFLNLMWLHSSFGREFPTSLLTVPLASIHCCLPKILLLSTIFLFVYLYLHFALLDYLVSSCLIDYFLYAVYQLLA